MNNLTSTLITLALLVSCSTHKTLSKHSNQESMSAQSTEQLSLQSQHDALFQGLTITFDSVALTVTQPHSQSTPQSNTQPNVVNLIARKATIEKSDIRTVTYEGLNARRDTVTMREEKTEMETHEVQKENGGKPPNWTVILIVLGALALLIYMLWEKH